MKPRVRPGVRRLAIVAAIILLPVAAHSLWDYIELRRVIREIKAIQARNEPVTERQAGRGFRTLQPDEERAARLYLAAAMLAAPAGADARLSIRPLAAHLAGYAPPQFDQAATERAIAAAVSEVQQPIALVARANQLPFNGFSPGTRYNYRSSELIRLLDVQSLNSTHLSLTQAGDAAVDAVMETMTARRTLRAELIEWPSSLAFDVSCALSYAGASTEALRRLEAALAAKVAAENVHALTILDRASYIETSFDYLYGGSSAAPDIYDTGRTRLSLVTRLWRPWLGRRLAATIRKFNELVAASSLPWPEKGRRILSVYRQMPAELPSDRTQYAQPAWWYPDALVLTFIPRQFRQLVLDRVAAVTVAVSRFRAEHGRLPANLDELTPGSPVDLLDPWSGEQLRYRSDAQSFTVYSVYPDDKDDGGDLISDWRTAEERGFGVRRLRGKDGGIRVLLNPE